MSAEIVQFVPRANPNREAPLCNAPDATPQYGDLTIQGCKYWKSSADTAPDGDCA